MSGLKVKCPNCRRTMFKTTEKYNPAVTPNGAMVRSLATFKIDWLTISTIGAAEMCCPACLAPLVHKGRLWVLEPEPGVDTVPDGGAAEQGNRGAPPDTCITEEKIQAMMTTFPCPICGKPFPSERRMKGHMGGAHKGVKG